MYSVTLPAVTVWNIFQGACIFYAVTSNKYMHIFNDVASYLVNWWGLEREAVSMQWEFCRQRCSDTHQKCFSDSRSMSKCLCNSRLRAGFIIISLRKLPSSWVPVLCFQVKQSTYFLYVWLSQARLWWVTALANLPVWPNYSTTI